MTESRHAILIGSSSFPDESKLQPLRCPDNDVAGLAEILFSKELGGFNEPIVLINSLHHEVLDKISRVFDDAKKNDLILIYYSGHGKQDSEGQLYLATANTRITSANTLTTSSIPVESIRRIIKQSRTNKVIFILDCCYSGAVGNVFLKGGADEQLRNVAETARGTFILTASTAIQAAVEKEGDEYGLLTKHIINGIRSGNADSNNDGLISMTELYDYVYENVCDEGMQQPMKWELGITGRELTIARSGVNEELQKQIFELFEEAKLARENQNWSLLIEKIQALQAFNPQHTAVDWLVDAQQQENLNNLYLKGLNHLEARELKDALSYFKQIINVNVDYKDVSNLIKKVKNERLNESFLKLFNKAETAINDEAWDTAIKKLERALSLDPNHEEAKAKLSYAKLQQEASALYKNCLEHRAGERWSNALTCFNQLYNNFGEYKDLVVLLEEAKTKVAEEAENRLLKEEAIKKEIEEKFCDIEDAIKNEQLDVAKEKLQEFYSLNPATEAVLTNLKVKTNQTQLLLARALQQQHLDLLYTTAKSLYHAGSLKDAWQFFIQVREKAGHYKDTTTLIKFIEHKEIKLYLLKVYSTLSIASISSLSIIISFTLLLYGAIGLQLFGVVFTSSISISFIAFYYAFQLVKESDYKLNEISNLRDIQKKIQQNNSILELPAKNQQSPMIIEQDKAKDFLSRRLRNLTLINKNKAIDIEFITCSEYQVFIDHNKKQGKNYQPDHWIEPHFASGTDSQPIVGVRARDAEDFCKWLNLQQTDNVYYRLPTFEEGVKSPSNEISVGAWCVDGGIYQIVGLPVIIKKLIKHQFSKLNNSGPPIPESLKNNLSVNLELNEPLETLGKALTFLKFNFGLSSQLIRDLIAAITLEINHAYAPSFINELASILDLKHFAGVKDTLIPFSKAAEVGDFKKLRNLTKSLTTSNDKSTASIAKLMIKLLNISKAETLLEFRQANHHYAAAILECAYEGYNLLDNVLEKIQREKEPEKDRANSNIKPTEEREILKRHQKSVATSFWYLQLIIAREANMIQSWEGIRIVKEVRE